MIEQEYRNADIEAEHRRWSGLIGPADPYLGRTTIGIHEVLRAHFLLLDFFSQIGEGVGGVGPRDIHLLHSALSRQFVQFGGKPKWTQKIEVCATLLFGLIKNHPFHDANKRTAFLTSILHLQKVGRTPKISGTDYENLIVDISNGDLQKYNLREKGQPSTYDMNILIISDFLKRSTRKIDRRSKIITYNQLNKLLSNYGYKLENPKHNHIDVVPHRDSNDIIDSSKRVAHIGFHGWKRQVSRKDIDIVRSAIEMDARHGFDSQSFFNGRADPLSLIENYREPLERLAFR